MMQNFVEVSEGASSDAGCSSAVSSETAGSGSVTATGSAGGNMVQVTLNGEFEMTSIKIDPIAVDPRDVNMLQDLIVAASHNASEKIKEAIASKAGPMLGGMGLDMPNMPNL